MSQSTESSKRISISPDFFCDGKFYVLTSTSLGGSHFTVIEISVVIKRE